MGQRKKEAFHMFLLPVSMLQIHRKHPELDLRDVISGSHPHTRENQLDNPSVNNFFVATLLTINDYEAILQPLRHDPWLNAQVLG
jgi:hypothetical protein